jgi:hypothetical protein
MTITYKRLPLIAKKLVLLGCRAARASIFFVELSSQYRYEVPLTPNEGHGFWTITALGFEEFP